MNIFVESGIQVDLTGKPHFRFENLNVYNGRRGLSGRSVKEMDFCWLDNGRLIMLELKSFSETSEIAKQGNISAADFTAYLIQETAPKIWDSLLMFSACWLPTQKGLILRNELDPDFHALIEKIHIVIVLDVPEWFKAYFDTLRQRFQIVLNGKLALFDCKNNLTVCMPHQLKRTSLRDYVRPAGDV